MGNIKESNRYPELGEQGNEQAIKLIQTFKKSMQKEAKEIIEGFYCGVLPYLESDSWTNFRTSILNDLCDYRNNSTKFIYDYKRIRKSIYDENKEQINKDLLS